MSAKRRPRGARGPKGRHRLTPRDLEILIAVARMRAPTAHQLARLFRMSLPAIHRRLRALAALGVITVHAPDLNRPNIVALTVRGRTLLIAEGVADEDIHVARNIVYHDIHAELVNDLRSGLVLAAHDRADVELDACLTDWDLRRELGRDARAANYIPDVIAVVRVADALTAFAFEVDRGFESTSEIRKKVRATLALSTRSAPLYGFTPWRPVLLVPTTQRLATLTRHIRDAGAGSLWACALIDARHDPLGPHYALAASLGDGDLMLDAHLVPPP
ncbi:MAG: replication-relaxation family protein [Deltaproteobacteria bacterium]|nr:replication-relaxation family protein [Deltaproteobacteria bacterium]